MTFCNAFVATTEGTHAFTKWKVYIETDAFDGITDIETFSYRSLPFLS